MTDTEFKALIEGIEVHLGNGTPSDSLGNDLDLFVDRDGRKFWRKCNGKWTGNALYVLGPLFLSLVPPVGVSPDVARVPVYRNGAIEWSEDIGSLDPADFESAGAVGAHDENPDAHSGTFDAAGAATDAVSTHNAAAAPHSGKFEAAGAIGTHNTSGTAHADIRALISGAGSSHAANGYEVLPSGLIIQWGTITPTIDGSIISDADWASYKQAFPVAFPVSCVALVAARRQDNTTQGLSVESGTIVRYDATHYYVIDRAGTGRPFTWIAIGY